MQEDTRHRHAPGWRVWQLAALLYVFVAAAVAINLFMLGLLMQAIGFTALSPVAALAAAGPLGIPAAWAAGKWVRRLLDEAET
ncbi:hypothetical protein MASR1M32_11410 [Rhodobacter sp.]